MRGKTSFLVVALILPLTLSAERFFVDASASPGGDGSGWNRALVTLQAALDRTVAGRGDEVWMAQGTYLPDEGPGRTDGDRHATFTLKDGVALYGGFAGGEGKLAERDPSAHRTVLSGEIANDPGGHALHVVTAGNGTVLDGLVVTRGNANSRSTAWTLKGGAVRPLPEDAAITARGCVFADNRAIVGGVTGGGKWTAIDCRFLRNRAESVAGVMEEGDWEAIGCVFADNESEGDGGVFSNGTYRFSGCVFAGNRAGPTGAGGVGQLSIGSVFALNSVFHDNDSANGGVAVSGNWSFSQCTFEGNGGGANPADIASNANVTARNCVIAESNPFLAVDFSDQGIFQHAVNLVRGGAASLPGDANTGTNSIIAAAPGFVDASDPDGPDDVWMTHDDGLRLRAGSPAVGAGRVGQTLSPSPGLGGSVDFPRDSFDEDGDGVLAELVPRDIRGSLRESDGALDLGAYEQWEKIVNVTGLGRLVRFDRDRYRSEFGALRMRNLGSGEAFGESLQAKIFATLGNVRSDLYGGLSPAAADGWLVSGFFGNVHFGTYRETYDGFVSSERFGWMRFFDDPGAGERFLWVPRLRTWMAVRPDGSFYSFDYRDLDPTAGFNVYRSPLFGLVTVGDFGGWVFSDRFGWMWAARGTDGTWFWSEGRQDWLGVTAQGDLWSVKEGGFL